MVGLRLQSSRNLLRVEDPLLGHGGGLGKVKPVGVLLPLRFAVMVSGEPSVEADLRSLIGSSGLETSGDLQDTLVPFQVRFASLATR